MDYQILNFLLFLSFIKLAMLVYRKHTFRQNDLVNIDGADLILQSSGRYNSRIEIRAIYDHIIATRNRLRD